MVLKLYYEEVKGSSQTVVQLQMPAEVTKMEIKEFMCA